MFKPHDRIQEEASQAKTKSMAEKAAAGENGSSSGKQLGEPQKYEYKNRQQKRLTNRIIKCSLPKQGKTASFLE